MISERGPEIKIEKEAKKMVETPTEETLFEGFYSSLERPTLENLKKLEKLKQITILSRVPPPYEETLKIVEKRLKIFQKNGPTL